LKKTFSILFVCTGNTCRSPLAEVILKSELRKAGIANVTVSSAGTGAFDGGRPSLGAVAAAGQMKLSLGRFRSKPLNQRRVRRADLILTMGGSQKEEILRRWPDAGGKTYVLSEFTKSGSADVQDPMGEPMPAYFRCAGVLKDELRRALPRIKGMVKRQKSRGMR
jgi:protein-tyrosine-phosphatase